jgi:hypothetical protein
MQTEKKYVIKWTGPAEVLALLEKHVPKEYESLGEARKRTRAITLLFPEIDTKILSTQKVVYERQVVLEG